MKYNFCLPVIIFLSLLFSCKKQNPVTPPPEPDPVPVSKTYGGSASDFGQAIIATGDGTYVLAATTASNDGDVSGNHGNNDFWLVKVDKSGNIIWQKTFGGSRSDEVYGMIATADGGYLLAGSTSSIDGDVTGLHLNTQGIVTTDAWVIKVDGNGKLLWQKALGGSGTDIANAIVASPDGGCVIAATSDSRDGDKSGGGFGSSFGPNSDAWIVKLNAAGSIVWQRVVGGSRYDAANAIITATNGGYVVAGSTSSEDGDITNKLTGGGFHIDALLFQISETGILTGHSTYGGRSSEYGLSVTKGNDGSYVLVGSTESYREGSVIEGDGVSSYNQDAWIVKSDFYPDGRKAVGSPGHDGFTSVVNVPNIGYIATGYGSVSNTQSWQSPRDILFYAFDEGGNILSQTSYEGVGLNLRPSIIYTNNRNYVIASSKTGVDGAGKPASVDAWIIHGSF